MSLLGPPDRFQAGLHDLGDGVHAWLQPNGSLGESNAGLLVGAGQSLLVDTLWDLRLTRNMLDAMAPLCADAPIATLVNTHADGDHCWGNQLLPRAEIVATRACAQDMPEEDPAQLERLRSLGRLVPPIGPLRPLRAFLDQMRSYDFAGIELTLPTRTFTGELELDIGGRRVHLIEVGPAHTPGDLIVHVPDAGVVFAADMMFIGVTPIMWVGPVERWLAALDRIEQLEPRVVVPGHGPLGGLEDVGRMRDYWELVTAMTRAGAAPQDILAASAFAPFLEWENTERLAVNMAIIERSDAGGSGRVSPRERLRLIARMGRLAAA